MKVEIEQIITQIISFLIILWILSRYAWKPFMKMLEDRKNKIQSDYDTIAHQKQQVDNLMNEYQEKVKKLDVEAQQKMTQVLEDAKLQAENIQNEAHQKAKGILIQAQQDLQKEISQARLKMKKELVEISLAAAERMMQKGFDKDKQKEFAQDFIDQMEAR